MSETTVFDSPSLPIECDQIVCREFLGVQFVAEVAIPFALLENLDQPHELVLLVSGMCQ